MVSTTDYGVDSDKLTIRKANTHILPALLDRIHQTVKMGAERLQTRGIQEETALARGVRSSARRIGALL